MRQLRRLALLAALAIAIAPAPARAQAPYTFHTIAGLPPGSPSSPATLMSNVIFHWNHPAKLVDREACAITLHVIHSVHDPVVPVQGHAGTVRRQESQALSICRIGRRAKAGAVGRCLDARFLAIASWQSLGSAQERSSRSTQRSRQRSMACVFRLDGGWTR